MSVTAGLAGLEAAFQWCCRRRKDSPPDADIWHLWFHWSAIREDLSQKLTCNTYRLSALQVTGRGRDAKAVWSAQDAVVLKWVAMQLQAILPVHPLCEHHKGHGGGKRSVQRMHGSLQREGWQYVCRTDIQGFYAHIRRGPLMRQLKRHVQDPVLLDLVRQYLHYSVERGGEFHTPAKGICRGCALSPLLAGFCLWAMDTYFEAQPHVRYVRFMDDMVIFTRTRWHLRQAVRALNVFFASGGYRQHPDKTFIGRTERGVDWMGIQFNGSGIEGVAPRALANHRERCRRLYEQVWRYGKKKTMARVSAYVKRWTIWRNSMTGSANHRDPTIRVNPDRIDYHIITAIAGLLATVTCLPASAGLPSCSNQITIAVNSSYSSAITSASPTTMTPGVNPPYPYIGSSSAGIGGVGRCSMGPNTTLSAVLGAYTTAGYWENRGGWWTSRNKNLTWGSDPDEYACSGDDYTSACLRVKLHATSPLICVGADGTQSASITDGNLTNTGASSASVACRDRPDGTGVDITLPGSFIEIASNSAVGLLPGRFMPSGQPASLTLNSAQNYAAPFMSFLLGRSPTSPVSSTCSLGPGPNDTRALTGPCTVNSIGVTVPITYRALPSGSCTAALSSNQMDWGTVNPGGGLTPGAPLPGVPTIPRSMDITCTGGGSENAALVTVTPHGSSDWRPDVFDSSNDSIGYKLTVGNRNVALVNHTQTVLQGPDGIQFQATGGNAVASTTITGTPVAKLAELLPGSATANITLDVYAVANQ